MGNKSVLGKGLASLIGSGATSGGLSGPIGPQEIEKQEVKKVVESGPIGPSMVDPSQISPNPYQPRREFKQEELEALSRSIKENGIIQPLIVTQREEGGFELIAGERRLLASKMAGLSQVPVIIKRATDKERLVMAIIENVQRADLNCIEEAQAYQRLMHEFHLTQEEVGKRVGKERSSVANFLRLLRLPMEVIEDLRQGALSFGHAKVLMGLDDDDEVLLYAGQAKAGQLSVRALEEQIKKDKRSKKEKASSSKELRLDEKWERARLELERATGLHIKVVLDSPEQEKGKLIILYDGKEEFNKIYDLLGQGGRS